jgi:hypothetical protein
MGLINRQKELEIIAGLGIEKNMDGNEVVLAQLLCCPITGLLMRDPVVGTDGCIYDRRALVAWHEHFGTRDVQHPFLVGLLYAPVSNERARALRDPEALPRERVILTLGVDVDYEDVHKIYLPLDNPNHVFTRSRFKACLDKGDIEYQNDGTWRAVLWIKSQIALRLGANQDNWLTTITAKGLNAMVKARVNAKENGRRDARMQQHHIPLCSITKDGERIADPVLDSSFNIYNRAEIEGWFATQRCKGVTELKGVHHDIVSSNLVRDRGADLFMWGNGRIVKSARDAEAGIIDFTPTPVYVNFRHIDMEAREMLADQVVMVLRGRLVEDDVAATLEDLRVMSLKKKIKSCSAVVSCGGKALASGSLKEVAAYMFFQFDGLAAELRYFIQTTVLCYSVPSFAMQAEAATFLRSMMCHSKEKSAIWQLENNELGAVVAECGDVRSAMACIHKYSKDMTQVKDTRAIHFFDKIVGHHQIDIRTDEQFKEGTPFHRAAPPIFLEASQKINDICVRKYTPSENARTSLCNAVVAIYINNMGRLLKEGSVSFINEVEAMKMLAFVMRAFSATYAEEAKELSITINGVYYG